MAKRYLLDFEKPLVELEKQIEQIKELARDSEVDVSQQLLQLETLAARRREEIFKSLTPAQKIQVARHPQRPSTLDFVQMFCDDWIELHGDRNGGDDMALIGGIGSINNNLIRYDGKKKIIENAETQYEILDKNNNSTFIQLKPITGRKHQLRKQLFDLGHSIIGDKKYNSFKIQKNNKNLMLHSYEIKFQINKKKYTFRAIPPEYFRNMLQAKRLNF